MGYLQRAPLRDFSGFWSASLRLRRYRADAAPLQPLPEAVDDARVRTGAEAEVRVSDAVGGPVTFGFRRPIILLPPAVLEQPAEAQFGIACHEFLHVRRRDWLFTVCEEFAGALLWFHPAVWWLLGQIRLAREQVVDRAVVSITESREPYVQALLALGGGRPQLDLAPATLFLRKRHLASRIHSLLKEVTVSKRRLVSSYVSIAAMLMLTAWFVVSSFPLQGSPQVETLQGAVADAPGVSVETGGRMLHRTSVRYPAEAITKGVQGIVVVEATLDSGGIVSDVRVLSGPAELRRSALEAVFQWHYVKDASTPARIQVTIDFRLPPPSAVPAPAPPPAAASSPNTKYVVGSIDVYYLPEPLQNAMRSRLAPFQGQPFSIELRDKIIEAVRDVDLHARAIPSFRPGPEKGLVLVEFTITLGAGASVPLPPLPPPGLPPAGVQRVPVGGAEQSSKLIHAIRPAYPPLARQARIQGPVSFTAVIGVDGKIQNLALISGRSLAGARRTGGCQPVGLPAYGAQWQAGGSRDPDRRELHAGPLSLIECP